MQKKRSSLIYLVLGIMVLALVGFSVLPLIGSILQENQYLAQNNSASGNNLRAEQLEKWNMEAKGYEKVLAREPDNNTALRGLLEVRLQQGDLEGAIAPLENLAKFNTEQTEYGILLAQAKQQIEDYEGAAAAYRDILTNHPEDIRALSGIVNLLLTQERPEQAIALLQDSLEQAEREPAQKIDVTSIQLLLGVVYSEQKSYDEAIAIYEELIEREERDFRPLLAKGMVMQEQGNLTEAKPLFEKAFNLAPAAYKDQIKAQIADLTVTEN